MAKANVPQQVSVKPDNGITKNEDHSVTLSSERSYLCLEATWEIDALARALPDLIPDTEENMATRLVVRGFAARIAQLSDAVMGGINDQLEPTAKLQRIVTLKFPEAANA